MSTSIDWAELIKGKKGVVTKDNQACGNIIAEDKDNIVIDDGAVNQHIYRIPKSSVDGYNGAQITLNLQYNELVNYEKGTKESITESITDSIKNTAESIENKIDKAFNGTNKE
jgi:hypothetical protein